MPVAAAAALAASLLHRPVCYSLNRNEDFAANAGRCAGLVEYDVGYTPQGKLVAIKAKVWAALSCQFVSAFVWACVPGGGAMEARAASWSSDVVGGVVVQPAGHAHPPRMDFHHWG
jgi:CO/xanthine dehydrogenase Mo-binding subunit